ncbi:MAG: hypothetical protein ABI366_11065 [Ginsengibacter sp.]
MRIAEPLTRQDKKFIEAHYQKMTLLEMTDELSLKSKYKVQMYLEENSLKKKKIELTEVQKDFIRVNFNWYSENEFARRFGLKSRLLIQKFKREEGLSKYKRNKEKKVKRQVVEGFFNVDEMSWAI